jgi:hypothetical protein
MTSQRGVGHEWINSKPNEKVVLFGSGGYLDGCEVSIINGSRSHNVEVEEALSLTGVGIEGRIDINTEAINNYNSNNEFNFSNYKRGPARPSDFYIGFGSELSSGDVSANILNPLSATLDSTVKSLGIETDRIWGIPDYGDEPLMATEGKNPFLATKKLPISSTQTEMSESMAFYEDDGENMTQNVIPEDVNYKTGLRRKYIKQNTSVLKERLAQKSSMFDTYNSVISSYADMEYGGKDEREKLKTARQDLLSLYRFDGSKYMSSQAGLNQISSDSAKKYRKSKKGRFNTTPIGV